MKVSLVQLGCPKNLVDGEWMLGQLVQAGHQVTVDSGAEVVIVNTCGFIDKAKEESVNAILEIAQSKKRGEIKRLIVAGCLVQRYKDELKKSIPEIDGFIPLNALGDVVKLLSKPDLSVPVSEDVALYDGLSPRLLSTPPHLAYVKISEGCDNPCAFCSIPSFKGSLRSRSPQSVVQEVRNLAGHGVREVVLIGQDTTDYGKDIGLSDGLSVLLKGLEDVEGIGWVRVLYLHPNRVTRKLLESFAVSTKAVPYLDLPFQHSHPDILRGMGRGGGAESFLSLLATAREILPKVAFRSAFLLGFPGEKRSHYLHLLDFINEARLDHVGAFSYSREEGTAAWEKGNPVGTATKERRVAGLMEIQQAISLEKNRARVGRTAQVLVDGPCEETEHLLQGRLATQAPEIDGRVLINDGFAKPGSFAKVKFSYAGPYDLVGAIVGK